MTDREQMTIEATDAWEQVGDRWEFKVPAGTTISRATSPNGVVVDLNITFAEAGTYSMLINPEVTYS